jgi:regulator of sigma E protease
VLSIVLTIVGLGLLIAVHEAGHLVLARLLGMRVETYSLGFGPRIAGFRKGDTDYRLSAFPFGGYCKIAGFTPEEPAAQDPSDSGSYANKPAWRRILVIAAGPGVNYLLAFAIIALLYMTRGFVDLGTRKMDVLPGGAAAAAGLQTGDEIVAVDGVPVESFDDLRRELVRPNAPADREVEVVREGARRSFPIHPQAGRIGVTRSNVLLRLPFGAAVPRAFADIWAITTSTISAVGSMFHGQVDSLAGPIGIVKQASAEVRRGLGEFAQVLATISVELAIFNFLPVPALDGGRLVFLGFELFSGRKVNPRAETAVHVVGFLLLIALFVAVTLFSDLQLGRKLFHR